VSNAETATQTGVRTKAKNHLSLAAARRTKPVTPPTLSTVSVRSGSQARLSACLLTAKKRHDGHVTWKGLSREVASEKGRSGDTGTLANVWTGVDRSCLVCLPSPYVRVWAKAQFLVACFLLRCSLFGLPPFPSLLRRSRQSTLRGIKWIGEGTTTPRRSS